MSALSGQTYFASDCERLQTAVRNSHVNLTMTTGTPDSSNETHDDTRAQQHLRRRIIFWIPAAILASVASTIVASAFRFLRPRAGEVGVASDKWLAVAKLNELAGNEPVLREVMVEHRAGWSSTLRGHNVFVMPGAASRVLSAVCPHEGCEVEWSTEQKKFLCPCHDSVFNAEGARLSGPAQSDLAQIPTRVNGDTLEMQFGDAEKAVSNQQSAPSFFSCGQPSAAPACEQVKRDKAES
jgi:Rieske Fe-S protein